MATHAMLSASGAHRWLECPPSAMLETKFQDTESEYAAEGTLAHELLEAKLRKKYNIRRPDTLEKYEDNYKEISKNELFSSQMEDYVDEVVDYVEERFNAAKSAYEQSEIHIEVRLDFSSAVPEGFGTGDIVIISDKYIEVIDLKYGKGVEVSAENNPQLRLYGYGALCEYDWLYDLEYITTTIHQPRLGNVSSENIFVDAMEEWIEETVKPVAALAFDGKGEYNAGEHCRFCKAKGSCRKRTEMNIESAKSDFDDPELLTEEEIGEILFKVDEFMKFASDIKDYALVQARDHGKTFPGWKIVEGRSNRKYKDEKELEKALKNAGYKPKDYQEKKLVGITKLEKVLGAEGSEILKDHTIKPPGKPALVPLDDKRPEMNSAVEDFKD